MSRRTLLYALGLVLLITAALLSRSPPTLDAQRSTPAWSVQMVDNSGQAGEYSSLRFDGSGNPLIAYFDKVQRALKLARFNPSTSSWDIETVDTQGSGYSASLALDSSGRPAVAYWGGPHIDLRYAHFNGSTWDIATLDEEDGGVWVGTSLAFDASDNPCVSYAGSGGNLKFARWTPSGASLKTVDTGGVGPYSSLAFRDGNPFISYQDQTSKDLKYAHFDGAKWVSETVDSEGSVGKYTSLAFDAEGHAAISYYDETNSDLKYARHDGSKWTLQTVDTTGTVGSFTSLAFDAGGNPAIAYFDQTNQDVKFAWHDGTAWIIEKVDGQDEVGTYASLAFDPNGKLGIAYYDKTNQFLKFATKEAGETPPSPVVLPTATTPVQPMPTTPVQPTPVITDRTQETIHLRGTVMDKDALIGGGSWTLLVREVVAGPAITGPVRVAYMVTADCQPTMDTSIEIGDSVEVFGGYVDGAITLCPYADYYIRKFTPIPPANQVQNLTQGKDYNSIREALVAAVAGDVIQVSGRFTENVKVDTRVTLQSANGAFSAVIHAQNPKDDVLAIRTSGVTVRGLTVEGATETAKAGIVLVETYNCQVLDNEARGNSVGIYLGGNSDGNTIRRNAAVGNLSIGVLVQGHDATDTAASNVIIENAIAKTNAGSGVLLEFGTENRLEDNVMAENATSGIRLKNQSNGNTIVGNTIRANRPYGLGASSGCDGNVIYRNHFIDNETQAREEGSNTWNERRPAGGNYWSDWRFPNHADADADGFLDDPYAVTPSISDAWPLVSPRATKPVYNYTRGMYYYFIQDAIDAARLGDRILVYAPVCEENVDVDKRLHLTGMAAPYTVVKAVDEGDHVFDITAVNVLMWGFKAEGADMAGSAGFHVKDAWACEIMECAASGNVYGVMLENATRNLVRRGLFTSNVDSGIYIYDSAQNRILDSQVTDNGTSTFGAGIMLEEMTAGATVSNTISGNLVQSNWTYGLDSPYVSGNLIYHNNFIDNYYDARDSGSNTWSLDKPDGGNYWKFHAENYVDADGDGFVDTPYSVAGGSNSDALPFARASGWTLQGLQVHNLNTGKHFATIQEAIDDRATQSGHVIEVDGGVFRETIDVTKSLTLRTKSGPSVTTVRPLTWNAPAFDVTSTDFVTVTGFTIEGASNGIWVDDSANVVIEGNRFVENRFGVHTRKAQTCTIRNNEIVSSTWGISFGTSYTSTVQSNTVVSSTQVGISLYQAAGNTISGNTVQGGGSGIELAASTGNEVKANQVLSNTGTGIGLSRLSSNNVVSGNTIRANQNGIQLDTADKNTLSDNNVKGNSDSGIVLTESDENEIKATSGTGYDGSVVALNGASGIVLKDSDNNDIWFTDVLSDTGSGISLSNSHDNEIGYSDVISSSAEGIRLYESSRNFVSGNRVRLSGAAGIEVLSEAGFRGSNTIHGNQFSLNPYGITLTGTRGNSIYANTVFSNTYGLYVRADYNTIFHNNVLTNTHQVDATLSNVWDKGRSGGGNFWSDWAEPDDDHDGIVDRARSIATAGGQDGFPFAQQNGWWDYASADIKLVQCQTDKAGYDPGATVKCTCNVRNDGSADGPIDLKVQFLDSSNKVTVEGSSTTTVTVGAASTLPFDLALASDLAPGTYTLKAVAYEAGTTTELARLDTAAMTTVYPRTGVKITSAKVDRSCLAEAEPLTLTVSVLNTGTVATTYRISVTLEYQGALKARNAQEGPLAANATAKATFHMALSDDDEKGDYDVKVKAYYLDSAQGWQLSDTETYPFLQYKHFTYHLALDHFFTQHRSGENDVKIRVRLKDKSGNQIVEKEIARAKFQHGTEYSSHDIAMAFTKLEIIDTDKEAASYEIKVQEGSSTVHDYNDKLYDVSGSWPTQRSSVSMPIGQEAIGIDYDEDASSSDRMLLWGCDGGSWCQYSEGKYVYDAIFRATLGSVCQPQLEFALGSPADLHLYDAQGRHVGRNDEGGVDLEIPGVDYSGPDAEPEILRVVGDVGEGAFLTVRGADDGTFDLTARRFTAIGAERITFDQVPTARGAEARVSIVGNELGKMQTDADGDGQFEEERLPSALALDSDADGVDDPADYCSATPHDAEVDAFGCPFDSDDDGVPDGLDRCPGLDDRLGCREEQPVVPPVVERWLDQILVNPRPKAALYRSDLATPIGDLIVWPQSVADPKGVFPSVARLQIQGYGTGEKTAETSMKVQVPADADIFAVPLATALNSSVDETDSEAGVVLVVTDEAAGVSSTTYAANVMETMLGEPYLYAYADVSPFRGKTVSLAVTLLHPDVCAGSSCTHDVDLYIGPVQFQQMPELCTTEADGSHVLYDYLDDPTPTQVEECASAEPYRLIEVEASADEPFENYGPGQDRYTLRVTLPEDFTLLDFTLHYGPRVESMSINGQAVTPEAVHASFPLRRAIYNRVAESGRYSFVNDNPAAVASLFKPGENSIEVVVAADKDWEERPFSLYARFLAKSEVALVVQPTMAPTATSTPVAAATSVPSPTPGVEKPQGRGAQIRWWWLAVGGLFVAALGAGVGVARRRKRQ